MKIKFILQTKHLLPIPILIILGACAVPEIRPTVIQTSELVTYSGKTTPSLGIESPTRTRTLTVTIEPTMSATPGEYRLVDWKEPTEVIGPDNIDRVEKVGEIQFTDIVRKIAWSPDGSRFGASSKGNAFIMDSMTFSQQIKVEGSFVVFSYDGKIIETAAYQYDLTTGEQ